jgi:hypothetical protein
MHLQHVVGAQNFSLIRYLSAVSSSVERVVVWFGEISNNLYLAKPIYP